MRNPSKLILAAVLLCGITSSNLALAQAFCALRDPVGSIYGFFPDADHYRSIVRVVGNPARDAIRTVLPLDLHFNELGKHTIYIAMQEDRPLGIVHARSESDRWGLTEIVWALDLELRVLDFSFQRCRNSARAELERPVFRSRLRGKSFPELQSYLSEDAQQLRSDGFELSSAAADLALRVLHSALKTIVVTEAVWESDLHSLRADAMLAKHFSEARSADTVPVPYTDGVLDDLVAARMTDESGIERTKLKMSRIATAENGTAAYLVDTPWRSGETQARLQLLIGRDGSVLDAAASGLAGATVMPNGVRNLVGFNPTNAEQCSNALELSALELSILARGHNTD